MIENLFSIPALVIYAIIYGVTMKIADLLNEHGLKWFRGSAIFFGFLWGIFGAALVVGNPVLANIILAMNLAFIIRNRLDCINHQIASSIIIITFLFTTIFSGVLFLVFYFVFLVFGFMKDYVDDILKKKSGMFAVFTESMLYYPIPTLIYSVIYGNWSVFLVFFFYTIAYNTTKYIGKKHGYS